MTIKCSDRKSRFFILMLCHCFSYSKMYLVVHITKFHILNTEQWVCTPWTLNMDIKYIRELLESCLCYYAEITFTMAHIKICMYPVKDHRKCPQQSWIEFLFDKRKHWKEPPYMVRNLIKIVNSMFKLLKLRTYCLMLTNKQTWHCKKNKWISLNLELLVLFETKKKI